MTALLSPRRSDRSDGASSEARDVLPSLPSSSSSLMFLNTIKERRHPESSTSTARRRQRVPSLYGNSSAATSDVQPVQGSTTFEYDVTSNLHRQQARRQRGDSNASISTLASYMSRSRSIAESMTSSIAAYERDGHVHGQFVSASSAAINDHSSVRSGQSTSLRDGGAAASLRRLGARTAPDRLRTDGTIGVVGGAHLTDRLETLIANSTSYRAAAAANRGQTSGRQPLADIRDPNGTGKATVDLNARHRKSSFASIRSLIGYSSSGAQRQTSTGMFESTTSRAASVFGLYMGGGGGGGGGSSTTTTTSRPAWAQPGKASAPTLTPINGEKLATIGRGDALGTLKGIRSQHKTATSTNTTTVTAQSSAKRANVRSLFAVAEGEAVQKQSESTVTSPLQSPTLSDGNTESFRHVSFQKALHKRAVAPNGATSPTLVNPSSSRRAFAALDPTSTHHAAGSATPRTVRSVKSPSSSRTSSHVDLASLSAVDANTNSPSPALSSRSKTGGGGEGDDDGDGDRPVGGAMPALDAALARAEDKSGLKTSSRCTSCAKRVINAPVSRSGDVFCSRDCRIETKRKRQAAAVKEVKQASSATTKEVMRSNDQGTDLNRLANGIHGGGATVAAPV